jgi:hypothetical protein
MPTPIEAYRQGYEKGRSDSAGGRLAEVTMGMLRDDPGGHFQKGYSDGAAGKPFSPPSTPQESFTKGLIPKFSENPFGWFFGVLIVIEFWVLWQLIKAPFQLVGSLMRSEKPSASVIVKNVIVAGLAIALVVATVESASTKSAPNAMNRASNPQSAHSPTSTPVAQSAPSPTDAPVPQSEYSQAIIGKWYPEIRGCDKRGIEAYEIFPGGRVRMVGYVGYGDPGTTAEYFGDCTLVPLTTNGHWEIKGGVLTLAQIPPIPTDYEIVFLNQQKLVIKLRARQTRYGRQPAGPYPAF